MKKKTTFLSCIEKKCKVKILLREIDFLFDNSDRDQIVFYNDRSDLKKISNIISKTRFLIKIKKESYKLVDVSFFEQRNYVLEIIIL